MLAQYYIDIDVACIIELILDIYSTELLIKDPPRKGHHMLHLSIYKGYIYYTASDILITWWWSSHISTICLRARKILGLLYRRYYGNVYKPGCFETVVSLTHQTPSRV